MARKLVVEIIGDASSLEKSLKRAGRDVQTFSSRAQRVAKVGLFGGAAAIVGGLAATLKVGVDEFGEMTKAAAQTQAVLKSTGGAANVTAREVDRLASSISNYSGQDDEAIRAGENLLLTFTNIRNEAGQGNDIFNQTARIMADVTQALGIDATQAALQLGKALNDPVRGVGQLRRVGVSFTQAQRDQIAALVETGRTMDAQRLILAELNREFGGSARIFGETLPGKLARLRETLNNLAGSFVEVLAPSVEKLADQMLKWLQNTKNQKRIIDDFTKSVETLAAAAETAADVFGKLIGTFEWLDRHKGPSGLDILGKIGLTGAFKQFAGSLGGAKLNVPGAAATAALGRQLDAIEQARAGLPTTGGQPAGRRVQTTADALSAVKRLMAATKAVLDRADAARRQQIELHLAQARTATEREAALLEELAFVNKRLRGQITMDDRIALEQEKSAVLEGIRSLNQAELDARKDAAAKIAEQNRKEREAAAKAAKQRADQLKALIDGYRRTGAALVGALRAQNARVRRREQRQQFAALGLGPEGGERIPGLRELRARLAKIREALTGTELDTPENRRKLAGAAKIFAGSWGKATAASRAAVDSFFDDLEGRLEGAGEMARPAFRALNARQIVQAIGGGLAAPQRRRLQSLLSTLGPGLTLPAAGSAAFAGAGATAGITINGGLNLYGVQNVQQLENELVKRQKGRSTIRRGAR